MPELQKTSDKHKKFNAVMSQGGREGALIGLIALCVFLFMALYSYNPNDPGWFTVGHRATPLNLAGHTGAWFASVFMNFFGRVSWLFPLLVGYSAVSIIVHRNRPAEFHWPLFLLRFGGFVLLVMCTTSLFSLYSIAGLGAESGGILGKSLADVALRAFNLPAATLLYVAGFLFALTLSTGLSWIKVVDRLGALTLALIRKFREWAGQREQEEPPTPARGKKSASLSPAPDNVPPSPGWFARFSAWRAARKLAKPEVTRQEPRFDTPAPSRARVVPPTLQPVDNVPVVGSAESPKIAPLLKKVVAQSKRAIKELQPSLLDDEGPIPSIRLLDPPEIQKKAGYSPEELAHLSKLLEEKLNDFGVTVTVVEVNPGPVITRFEIQPAAGVKVSRISNLVKDLARSMAVQSVRVVEVIPGKSVVGIEIPNHSRQMVRLSEVISSRAFDEPGSPLTMALGNDIAGNPVVTNLAKMPHLLVAGTTGSGKSVGVNAMIISMLMKATPEEVRFIMVDPKMLELSIYEGIPHLLTPVVTDMKEAAGALRWCVAEMERRYRLMANLGVRNLTGYNRKIKDARDAGEPLKDPFWKPDLMLDNSAQAHPDLGQLPFIVVVIDEFADMMMIVGKKVEELIARIAQKARAAGIHLILATQRPSVDVITGLIKANIPTRMAFQVSSKIDSRTILDQGGAEQLLGNGDMLYLPAGSGLPMRVHGAFVADDEVHRIVAAWKSRAEPDYLDIFDADGGEPGSGGGNGSGFGGEGDSEGDALFDQAIAFVTETRRVSISSVQRKFKIGYNRAANLVEAMEAAGVVTPAGHNGSREVLAAPPPRD